MLLDPEFGKQVRAARRARDWSQSILALRLDRNKVPDPSIISKIENGLLPVSEQLRKRLTRILGLKA